MPHIVAKMVTNVAFVIVMSCFCAFMRGIKAGGVLESQNELIVSMG